MARRLYIFFTRYKIIKNILISIYKLRGRIPWSLGYEEYKWKSIENNLRDPKILENFKNKKLTIGYGKSLDERIVEYGWIFSNLNGNKTNLLDAGSTFNFYQILDQKKIADKNLTVYTYRPERTNFNKKKLAYAYGDLRSLPFQNNYFEEIVCQSTLEHVDMDNSIYGYEIANSSEKKDKSYDYLKVISGLERTLKGKGTLLMTIPFGKFENHGFFQQFDLEMVDRIKNYLVPKGELALDYFKYVGSGWIFSSEESCSGSISFNPHTGQGKGEDGAAHCRAICCIKFIKS